MAQKRKELLSSAPWRAGPQEDEKFKDAKMKVTSQPGVTPTMHVPGKKKFGSKNDAVGEDSLTEIDPELRYSFQRNFQFLQNVFSVDTVVKPLPPTMAYNVSCNLSFFTRIFTQFFEAKALKRMKKYVILTVVIILSFAGARSRRYSRCTEIARTRAGRESS